MFVRVASDRAVFFRAQDEADGWILAVERPMLAGVVEVEMHLPGIGMRESIELQVDDHEAAQATVEKE